jgi:hypothetical protein
VTAVGTLRALVGAAALVSAGTGFVPAARAAGDVGLGLVGLLLIGIAVARRGGRRTALVATGLVAAAAYTGALRATGSALSPQAPLDTATCALGVWCLALTLHVGVRAPRPAGSHAVLAAGALLPAVVLVPLWTVALSGAWEDERLPLAAVLDLGLTVPAGVLAASLLLRRRRGGLELASVLFVGEAALMVVFTGAAAAARSVPGDWIPTAALAVLFVALAVGALRAGGPRRAAPAAAEQVRLAT